MSRRLQSALFCLLLVILFLQTGNTQQCSQRLWEQQAGTPSPPHHFSDILTVKLIFQFLLRDIWLTEQRCHWQPWLGGERRAGGGRKENIGQNTKKEEEEEERETKMGNREQERLKQGSKGSQRRPVMFPFITATCSFPNVYFPEALQYKWTEVGVFFRALLLLMSCTDTTGL